MASIEVARKQSARGVSTMRGGRPAIVGVGVLAVALMAGCGGPPQVGAPNRRLVESLKTAIMARNGDWLEQNAKLVEAKHAQGELTDEAYDSLHVIINQAQAGDWPAAQEQVIALSKAQ